MPLMTLLICVTLAEGADNSIFPSITKALERTISFDVGVLGRLATVQLLVQAFAGPFWGVMASRGYMTRKSILSMCTMGQGLATLVMWVFVENEPIMWALRAVNGASLAGLRPIANSIVGDRFDDDTRGKYFGYIMMALQSGIAICSVAVTITSEWCTNGPQRFGDCPESPKDCDAKAEPCQCDGFYGWQVSFILIGILTIALAPAIFFRLNAPPVKVNESAAKQGGGFATELQQLGRLFRRPTFAILVFQGCFGLIPWRAFDFRTFFFETAGLDKTQVATINVAGGIAAAFGSLLGGLIGDALNKCWWLHGRVLAAEISVYGGIPFAFFTFYAELPSEATAFLYFFLLTFGLAGVATWTPGACNNPILSALADEHERALVLSWQTSLEGAIGALGPIVFTWILPRLGYDKDCNDPCTRHENCGTVEDNVKAAGFALFLTSCVPWTICGGLYSCLHCTYPSDLKAIEEERRAQNDGEVELMS